MLETISEKPLFDSSNIEEVLYLLETKYNMVAPTTHDALKNDHSDIIVIDDKPYLRASALKTIKATHKYTPDKIGKSVGLILLSDTVIDNSDDEYEILEGSDNMHHLYIKIFED